MLRFFLVLVCFSVSTPSIADCIKDQETVARRARAAEWSKRERLKETERKGRALAACDKLKDQRERRECEFWRSL